MAQQQTTNPPANKLVWFEIPAADFDRAVRFYETVFETKLLTPDFGPSRMGVFPYDRPAVSGCVMEGLTPSEGGVVAYLNASPSLDAMIARVKMAGGEVVVPRTEIGNGIGFFCKFRDSEGNIIGLHALA